MKLRVIFKSGQSAEIRAREFETRGATVTFRWFEGQTQNKFLTFDVDEIAAVVRLK
jgi:hypothetical protein